MEKTHISFKKIALIWNALICHIDVLVAREVDMLNNIGLNEKFEVSHSYKSRRDILAERDYEL